MIHQNVQKLINDYQEILDRDPLDQMEDTQSILTRFAQQLAAEIGEIVVASPYMEGTRMYFDEKIARYEIKKSLGLVEWTKESVLYAMVPIRGHALTISESMGLKMDGTDTAQKMTQWLATTVALSTWWVVPGVKFDCVPMVHHASTSTPVQQ